MYTFELDPETKLISITREGDTVPSFHLPLDESHGFMLGLKEAISPYARKTALGHFTTLDLWNMGRQWLSMSKSFVTTERIDNPSMFEDFMVSLYLHASEEDVDSHILDRMACEIVFQEWALLNGLIKNA